MIRRLDNDFVRTDSVHTIKQAFPLAVQLSLDSQRGKLVGNYAHIPARRVCRGATAPPVGQYLRRRLALIAITERTKSLALDVHALTDEVCRPLGTVGGNNHPTTGNWIPS